MQTTTTKPNGGVAAEDTTEKNQREMEDSQPPSPQNRSSPWRKSKGTADRVLDRWPRLVALARNQLLFLALLAVSFLMGYIISWTEGPSEVLSNDSKMRGFFLTQLLPIDTTIEHLVALPATCMIQLMTTLQEEEEQQLLENGNNNNTNSTVAIDFDSYTDQAISDLDYLRMDAVILKDTNTTLEEFYDFTKVIFEESGDAFGISNTIQSPLLTADMSDSMELIDDLNESNATNQQKIYGYVQACRGIAQELVMSLIDYAIEANSAKEKSKGGYKGLSFNWIRCWDQSLYGKTSIRSSKGQRNASLLTSQTFYYAEQWNKNRSDWFDFYVAEQGCDEMPENNSTSILDSSFVSDKNRCYWEATMKSVSNATGKEGCVANSASSSWFWFTVMTTVGYGNATPNTMSSRVLVYCFGWLMIVAFGGVMFINAYTLTALLDDILRRVNLNWLKRPIYSTPLWATASVSYIVLVAWYARRYWDTHVPNDVYTLGDSYWFSYITLLTVGFGDFYVQPQGLFVADVIVWTFLLLHGFGILASFLDRFTDLVESWLPKSDEPFEYHLARTDLLGTGINTPYSKSLDILRELVNDTCYEDDSDGSSDNQNETRKRSSFFGRDDWALTPDGNTINLHRIKILTEKKTLLIKLLLSNQSELEERMASSAIQSYGYDDAGQTHENSMLASTHSSLIFNRDGTSVALPMPTVEALEQDEAVLHSILSRVQDLRRNLGNISIRDDEQRGP